MLYRPKKNKKNLGGGGCSQPSLHPLVRPRVNNPKSPNGTETNQLTIYKRGRGFSRVIQIILKILRMHCKYFLNRGSQVSMVKRVCYVLYD